MPSLRSVNVLQPLRAWRDAHAHLRPSQTDTRIGSIEVKIKKLDGELARYKEQMARLRNGPGKVCSLPSTCLSARLTTLHPSLSLVCVH